MIRLSTAKTAFLQKQIQINQSLIKDLVYCETNNEYSSKNSESYIKDLKYLYNLSKDLLKKIETEVSFDD